MTKLPKSIKGVLNRCKLQAIFKIQIKLCSNFRLPCSPNSYMRCGVQVQCGLCNEYYYGECVRHLPLKCGEHAGISPLANRRIQPRKDSSVRHHLLNFNYSGTIEYFSVLCHENKKCTLKLKESLIIMRDRPSMNRNIRSTFFYLFE